MSAINIIVDLQCNVASWSVDYTRYRLYVNTDLITERDWIWKNNMYLKESIWIQPQDNKNYILRIQPIVRIPEQATFKINNLSVKTHTLSELYQVDDLQVNFRVDKYIDKQLESQQ